MVSHTDSVEKVFSYLEAASVENIDVSPLFFREYDCPEFCGGCCPKFSLDYFEGSARHENLKKLYPMAAERLLLRKVNGVRIWTEWQSGGGFCMYLNKKNGRCGIHKANPFTCAFELMKFITKRDKVILINKLYGRGWNLTKIDGEKGALCKMGKFRAKKLLSDIALLRELQNYGRQLGAKQATSNLGRILKYLEDNYYKFEEGKLPEEAIRFYNKLPIHYRVEKR